MRIDMSFPQKKAFNPEVTSVPVISPSSGNPKAFQDPNSVASLGLRMQASSDQIKADTLYDPPIASKEGFSNEFRNQVYSPWILGTEACKKEGFKVNFPESLLNMKVHRRTRNPISGFIGLVVLIFIAVNLSFRKYR
jgi:hypothetical protein